MTVKLIRCYIENFGGLSHVSQEFGEGLTVVKALNGLGKTTLAEFIRAMFYGFPHSGRALERNSRRKYTPWQGGRYGGNLTFRYEGELYRVERFFGEAPRQDTFALYQGESGVPCGKFSPRLGEELFRLDSDSFLRSVYLPQLREGGALSTAGIQARLSNLMEDTDDLHNFEKAMEALRRKRSALVSYRGDGGSVRQAQSRITALQKELDSLEEVTISCGAKHGAVRMVIGQTGPLSYLAFASEGPEHEGSKGLTILEAADVAYELGCINAYNLDGGATATICIGEKQVNSYWKQKERSIGDIIYFATLVPSGAEEETHE